MAAGDYLTQSQLRDRHGWSKTMIDELLGEADKKQGNPRNPKKPTKLYSLARVETVEASEDFAERSAKYLSRTANRRQAHADGLAAARQQLVERTPAEIVPRSSFAELAEHARAMIDAGQAAHEHQGAVRYLTIGDFQTPAELLGHTWHAAGELIFPRVIDVLDVDGYPQTKLKELVGYWVPVLMTDAWPTFAELVAKPPKIEQLREEHPEIWEPESREAAIADGMDTTYAWSEESDLLLFWLLRTVRLAPDGHEPTADRALLLLRLDEALREGGSSLAPPVSG